MLKEIQRFLRSKFVFDEDKETALASCMLNYINLTLFAILLCLAWEVWTNKRCISSSSGSGRFNTRKTWRTDGGQSPGKYTKVGGPGNA